MFKPTAIIPAISLALVIGGAVGRVEAAGSGERQARGTHARAESAQSAAAMERSEEDAKLEVRNRLMSLGLTSVEADAKIASLTTGDLQKLGQNPEQIAMAGIKDTTLILIAVILVVPSLLLLLML